MLRTALSECIHMFWHIISLAYCMQFNKCLCTNMYSFLALKFISKCAGVLTCDHTWNLHVCQNIHIHWYMTRLRSYMFVNMDVCAEMWLCSKLAQVLKHVYMQTCDHAQKFHTTNITISCCTAANLLVSVRTCLTCTKPQDSLHHFHHHTP